MIQILDEQQEAQPSEFKSDNMKRFLKYTCAIVIGAIILTAGVIFADWFMPLS